MAFKLNLGTLQVTIGADTDGLKRGEREVKRATKGMSSSFAGLGRIIAGVLSVEAVRRTIMLADSMNMLDAQIRNVTKNAESFRKIRDGIREIAMETGNSIDSVTRLSQALLIAGESIGATDDQILQMTSNLNKLGTIGGASVEAMKFSMRQFGQAMAGGIVRAEEFNSIVENTPLIAKAIADGMGLTVGELRRAVINGTVLSEDVFKALEGQTENINKQFEQMPMTISRATGMLQNSFAMAVQDIDKGLGLTTDMADAIADIAEGLDDTIVPAFDAMYLNLQEILMLWEAMLAPSSQLASDTFDMSESWRLITEWVGKAWTFIKEFPIIFRDLITIFVALGHQLFINLKGNADKFLIFFSEGMLRVIQSVQTAWTKFIGSMQSGLANIFEFFGADEVAEALKVTGDAAIAEGIRQTEANEEQAALRMEMIQQEIDALNAKMEASIAGSQMAMDMGLAETDDLRKNVKERIKLLKTEMKERRKSQKEVEKADKTNVKKNEDNLQERIKDLAAYQSSVQTLEQAGLIDSKTAALMQIGISTATAIAKTAELGFPQALPFIAQAIGTMASAKQSLSGAGRQFGGSATGGMPIPVNEAGPEMFINNAGRQFLLPDQSGKIVPMKSGGGSMGGMNVIINNNSSAEVLPPVFTKEEVMIEIRAAEERAVETVNSSLASGRGETFNSLQQGSRQTRNI